ncbi:SDR family oxidoreductase (plasmid) [Rhizobium ruizarguesonis]|uniref:SDR family NAD(P)-dependent oxidoreductase n=1 Tax=Rhizobium TaxID=379 RepID=UPI00103250D5|nr:MULTISPECIES: SDR family oxidoreductase [Rhizobium]MBB3649148.1 NAD(P)-dependent dehydrogenase (short-subunit alcohol dehydrogenase family) [Rhizobium sp. BK619]TBB14935.1 SDR family oxidoreductase [Rhizobium ruizarguesonis]
MIMTDLKSAIVPVSGGASGIGLAICRQLRSEGARPLPLDFDADQLEKALTTLYPDENCAKFGYLVDVSDSLAVDAAFEKIRRDHGIVTHAVANAGIVWRGNVLDMPEDKWKRVLDVNVNGVLHICRAAARQMTDNGGGAIVTMASIGGILSKPERAAYTTSKAAIVQMTRAFALDFAQLNIRVNCVAPGLVKTSIQQAQAASTEPGFVEALAARAAIKRVGEPEEIANVAMFLLSNLASYITGETVVVDGGLSIHYS